MIRRASPSQPRLILGVTALLLGGTAIQLAAELSQRGYLFVSVRWTVLFLVSLLVVIAALVLFAATWTGYWGRIAGWFDGLIKKLSSLGPVNLVIFLLVVIGYAGLILGPPGRYLKDLLPRVGLFWIACLAGAVFLKAYAPRYSWLAALSAAWVLTAAGYRLAVFIPDISTYPFTLSWSEASRYYYASLFFSEKIYGESFPPSPLHPSRYLLQAIPFLVPLLPLWFHRLWQVILWLGTSFGLASLLWWRLTKRLAVSDRTDNPPRMDGRHSLVLLFSCLVFLYLFQGPVYYHLLLIPILLLAGFSLKHPWRVFFLVVLASSWAGISRVNWFPVPGMLAAALFLLETDLLIDRHNRRVRTGLTFVSWPLIWICAGTLTAFISQAAYIYWSGVEGQVFLSSFTSELLWYRLWPNPTFPLGILPAALLVSAPMVALLVNRLRGLHPVRLAGLYGILAVLFIGGVIVSAKIGGGSNLHNLDAYLILLLVMGCYALFRRVKGGVLGEAQSHLPAVEQLAALSVIPALLAIATGGYHPLPERVQVASALSEIQSMVAETAQQGGEVLFISERQLLTFRDLPGVRLVDPYEKVFLMEMAMAGNRGYLDAYYQDLAERRYALIITDPMKDILKGASYSFGEENDAWVLEVVRPTLDDYRRKELYKELGIEVLEPRP